MAASSIELSSKISQDWEEVTLTAREALLSHSVWGSICRLGAEAPAKIEGVTLMRPIHSNLTPART